MAHKALGPFSGWAGPRHPKMLVIGEAWGESEHQTCEPLVGASGIEMWRMLGEAMLDIAPEQHAASLREAYKIGQAWIRNRRTWLNIAGIAYTNVFNFRPPANKVEALCVKRADPAAASHLPALSKGLYLRKEYLPEVERLIEEIAAAKPNLILAAGNTACWAVLRAINISAIRGTVSLSAIEPHTKVLPCIHPAAILRQWPWRPITVADLIKASREMQFPEIIRPERLVKINPTMHDIISWKEWLLNGHRPPLMAVDVETKWGQIKCIGFAWARDQGISIPFRTSDPHALHYWATHTDEVLAYKVVKEVLESSIPKLFQNGMYDLQYIFRWGIRPDNVAEDSMLLHHSLYPELRKGLGFLGSIYTNEAAWKLMGREKADTVKRDE